MRITIGEKKECKPLPIGGRDQQGNQYEANSQYLVKNGKPILPIMGEFHFSRWTPSEWEESLLKMKAGGVEIVATYVFWIHHEEKKGEWDFTGNRDIRAFLEICKKVQMPVWLRIGPWAHGECRNGGFPDWLVEELGDNGLGFAPNQEQKHQARTDDALYLGYVREFWSRLSKETAGMMCKDGGPVIGIQLENEYCHAGGPRDTTLGIEHMKTLKKLALEYGFEAPYYTATGWGGAIVIDKEMLPVMGGYVDAPWAGHTKEMPACENFLFAPFREDENIGADLKIEKEQKFTFSREDNPYLTAELGGGLQVTSMRRTYPFAQDIEAQTICMLGAGANLLGYYMYHGGFNPEGKYSTLQESRETGYFNELPIKSYDFQTCIRESGKINDSYQRLKKVHLMIQDFEEILAPAQAYFPEVKPENAEDMHTPRVSVRYNHDTKEGFLFINNHQRLRKMEPIRELEINLELPGKEEIILSKLACDSGNCAVIPFQLRMGESRLLYTNTCLLAKVGERYFFYGQKDVKPCFLYEDKPYENVVLLDCKEANRAYQFGSQFYVSPCPLIEQDGILYMLTDAQEHKIKIYEEIGEAVELYLLPPEVVTTVVPTILSEDISADANTYELQLTMKKEIAEEMQAEIEEMLDIDEQIAIYGDLLHEIYLHIDFAGDRAELYEDDKLIADWFSNGEEWVVALKRFSYPQKLRLKVYPYVEDVYYDLKPKKGCGLSHIYAESEYKIGV